jgi:transcriptional regulator with XRE-family HTH domain
MSNETLKFGTSARQQIGRAIGDYVSDRFGTATAAANDLGISRQRLHSYTSGKSLPRAEVFDTIAARWKLPILGIPPNPKSKRGQGKSIRTQMDLFHSPMILRNDQVEVIVKRKGAGLVAEIKISASVKVA